jgi:hypothetical protein
MTLITVGTDTELLIRQLRQRLAYLNGRIATMRQQEHGDDFATGFTATGALLELHNERDWLQGLIQSVQGEL